jgi:hypothetical protein
MNDNAAHNTHKKTARRHSKKRITGKRKTTITEARREQLRKATEASVAAKKKRRELAEKEGITLKQAFMMSTLTEKQRKLVINLADGMPKSEAGIAAGYSPESVSSTVAITLKNEKVQESLQNLMEAKGLGTDKLLEVHKEMLQATKVISVVTGKDANGSTMDFIDVPDWSARGQGLNMGYKLKGLYADQNLNITAETHEQRMQRLLGIADSNE